MTEPTIAKTNTSTPSPEPAGPLQRSDLANVYNANCAACHGVDGTGNQIRKGLPTIPDFTSLAWQMSQTDIEITHQIEVGKEPLMPGYRDKLSQRQILAMSIYIRAFAVETPTLTPNPGQPAPIPVAAAMRPDQVYRAYCMACHNADGSGDSVRKAMPEIPSFIDRKWQSTHLEVELKKSILDGKGKFMLPMKDKLSLEDATQMVAYLRAFQDGKQVVTEDSHPTVVPPTQPAVVVAPKDQKSVNPPPILASPEMAERIRVGTVLYRQSCLTCHGNDGRGTQMRPAMPTIPDFTNGTWQKQVGTPQLVASILDGKGTLMPANRGKITDGQAKDLAAYVRAFGPGQGSTAETPATDFEKRFHDLESQWKELERQLNELPKPPQKP